KSQPEQESVAVPGVARLLIVPAPGQAELQAIVLIGDPKAMANGFIAVGNRNRVLLGIGEVNDRRPEYGPEARDLQPAANLDSFPVLEILRIRADVAVNLQISDHGISAARSDRGINLVRADRQAVLVQPIAVAQADEFLVADGRAPDDVRHPPG